MFVHSVHCTCILPLSKDLHCHFHALIPKYVCVVCVVSLPDMSVPAGGVTMQVDSDGRETGEAYVEFTKAKDAENALHKDRQTIGHRLDLSLVKTCTYIHVAMYGLL